MADAIVVPLWGWVALTAAIAVMLAIDLFLHRDNHVISFREAAVWSSIWIAAGLGFGVIVWWVYGAEVSGTYYAGYLIEKALSVDNVFVFALIFTYFAVPDHYQHKVLFWGVIGALLFRLVFIFIGAELLAAFFWTAYLFGAFLIYTAVKLVKDTDHDDDADNGVVRFAQKHLKFTDQWDGLKLWIKDPNANGKRLMTPMFLVIVALGTTDLLFALDSIPAIYGLTREPYLVFTANVFALMGLRQLYFLLGDMLKRLVYLSQGLAFILGFIGVKLLLHALHENEVPFINGGEPVPVPEIPTLASLGVIIVTLAITTAASLYKTRVHDVRNGNEGDTSTGSDGDAAAQKDSDPEGTPADTRNDPTR